MRLSVFSFTFMVIILIGMYDLFARMRIPEKRHFVLVCGDQ